MKAIADIFDDYVSIHEEDMDEKNGTIYIEMMLNKEKTQGVSIEAKLAIYGLLLIDLKRKYPKHFPIRSDLEDNNDKCVILIAHEDSPEGQKAIKQYEIEKAKIQVGKSILH